LRKTIDSAVKSATRLPNPLLDRFSGCPSNLLGEFIIHIEAGRHKLVQQGTDLCSAEIDLHITAHLIQPKLWLTHQEPITIGNGTCGGRKDRVDVSSADGAYEGKATDSGIGIHLLKTWYDADK
jgi:hypothetical protein